MSLWDKHSKLLLLQNRIVHITISILSSLLGNFIRTHLDHLTLMSCDVVWCGVVMLFLLLCGVWWCGGVVVWWCGGVVVWWCGGVHFCTPRQEMVCFYFLCFFSKKNVSKDIRALSFLLKLLMFFSYSHSSFLSCTMYNQDSNLIIGNEFMCR